NGECLYVSVGTDQSKSACFAWRECWNVGKPLDAKRLATYEKYFELRNRYRKPADLVVLGVADDGVGRQSGKGGTRTPNRAQTAISNAAASVTWTGLQSFTGEYDLQVEFPRDAGAVLSRILSKLSHGSTVNLACEDGEVRPFIFRYYHHNGMFRL